MNRSDRLLYHQIHPVKLGVDVTTAIIATVLLWNHRLLAALVIGFVPSIITSAILLRWGDLDPYANSRLGKYVGRFMTHRVELARCVGLAIAWVAAWHHWSIAIAIGAAWIAACWLLGLLPVGADPV